MSIVSRTDTQTREKKYGIKGVDMDGSSQIYPYGTKAEAMQNEKLVNLQNNPKDPRFKDPAYVSTLKALGRI